MIKLEVKSAFEELKVAVENLETAKTALKQARENYRITELRYKENLTTSTEVLDARTYLTEAEVNYYDALYGYMIAKAKLEYSIAEEFSE
jgi:outer membrane protein TolC